MAEKKTGQYTADDLTKLEYPVSIWRRPSMYLGERGSQQTVALREIIDNSVHEVVRGHATHVKVTFGADNSFTVYDNGRGLPTDTNTKTGINGIILCLATLHAGANFSNSIAAGKAGAGLNGVGASAATALSRRLTADVFRGGKVHTMEFQDGFSGHFTGEGPDATFTADDEIKVTKDTRPADEKKLFKTGTKIRLWFNGERFPEGERVDIEDLIARLKYTAYVVPGIQISVVDETRTYDDGSFYTFEFASKHGLQEMVELEAPDEQLPGTDAKGGDEFRQRGVYHLRTQGEYPEITADEQGNVVEVKRTVTAELALRYGTGYEKKLISFVNTIQTHLGGVHEQALEQALVKTFGERMNSMRGILKSGDEQPIIEDYFEGLTMALSINVPEPQFVGQQKDRLSGPEVKKALLKAFTKTLSEFANAQENQAILRPMFEKVAGAAKRRREANEAKLAKRKSSQVSQATLPTKLKDCDLTGTEEAELIICEGDSAAGTVQKARDATYQAVIPIRGKMLNCYKATLPRMLANEEILSIAQAIGAGLGDNFDIDKIRYGKILFAADADVDGLEINNLLFALFNRLFRPMIEEGRVYQTVPPLYEVKVGSGKNQVVHYAADDAELNAILKDLELKKVKNYKIDRNKGLGEMDPEPFYDTVLNPERRRLRRITLEDVAKAEEALELTMGDDADARKDFMGENFQVAIDSGLVEGFESADV